jgi:hypothetical protein
MTRSGMHTGTITDPASAVTELTLSREGPALGPAVAGATGASSQATPNALTRHGSSFTVRWKQGATPPAPPRLASPDQIRHSRSLPSTRQPPAPRPWR